ncbi:hypothetical protein CYY_001591 [Polysphondylium violaceum]|uniref:Transmembrane protein n=1 Tax=Polysphondylium violaceum TaxID=133409 RepID=A0A8J4Q2T4_9MYCE|nr:hypothetical protein CYY_001591 [Polysphondylium violaceum]
MDIKDMSSSDSNNNVKDINTDTDIYKKIRSILHPAIPSLKDDLVGGLVLGAQLGLGAGVLVPLFVKGTNPALTMAKSVATVAILGGTFSATSHTLKYKLNLPPITSNISAGLITGFGTSLAVYRGNYAGGLLAGGIVGGSVYYIDSVINDKQKKVIQDVEALKKLVIEHKITLTPRDQKHYDYLLEAVEKSKAPKESLLSRLFEYISPIKTIDQEKKQELINRGNSVVLDLKTEMPGVVINPKYQINQNQNYILTNSITDPLGNQLNKEEHQKQQQQDS